MISSIIRVTCEQSGCPQRVALIGGCILPQGWGETVGKFDDSSDWHPSVFWCPAHNDGTKVA